MEDSYNENQVYVSTINSHIPVGLQNLDNKINQTKDLDDTIKHIKSDGIAYMNSNISNLKKKNEEAAKPL
jgi:hypothetical protein